MGGRARKCFTVLAYTFSFFSDVNQSKIWIILELSTEGGIRYVFNNESISFSEEPHLSHPYFVREEFYTVMNISSMSRMYIL